MIGDLPITDPRLRLNTHSIPALYNFVLQCPVLQFQSSRHLSGARLGRRCCRCWSRLGARSRSPVITCTRVIVSDRSSATTRAARAWRRRHRRLLAAGFKRRWTWPPAVSAANSLCRKFSRCYRRSVGEYSDRITRRSYSIPSRNALLIRRCPATMAPRFSSVITLSVIIFTSSLNTAFARNNSASSGTLNLHLYLFVTCYLLRVYSASQSLCSSKCYRFVATWVVLNIFIHRDKSGRKNLVATKWKGKT